MFYLQHSVSKHAIAFTGNVSIKLDEVARCKGLPQCMLRVVWETSCADDNGLTKLVSNFWWYYCWQYSWVLVLFLAIFSLSLEWYAVIHTSRYSELPGLLVIHGGCWVQGVLHVHPHDTPARSLYRVSCSPRHGVNRESLGVVTS